MRTVSAALLLLWAFAAPALAAECRDTTHKGDSYTVCTIDDPSTLDLFLRDPDGFIVGEFSDLGNMLAARGMRLGAAMNGGMYHEDRGPVGLYVSAFQEQKRIVTREGPGNFGLLPNGVFCIAGAQAQVTESRAFDAARPECRIATQSGPMLVIDGALHPRFMPNSPSRKRRNGVGVDTQGRVHFAISNGFVRFHDFATLFRDDLDTPNALFLDGTISRLHAPSLNRSDPGARMGPILAEVLPSQ